MNIITIDYSDDVNFDTLIAWLIEKVGPKVSDISIDYDSVVTYDLANGFPCGEDTPMYLLWKGDNREFERRWTTFGIDWIIEEKLLLQGVHHGRTLSIKIVNMALAVECKLVAPWLQPREN
jgi:hypothetical protein